MFYEMVMVIFRNFFFTFNYGKYVEQDDVEDGPNFNEKKTRDFNFRHSNICLLLDYFLIII